METLPTEIKVEIFTHLSDLSSVKSLSQISTSFHAAFLTAKDSIIETMVKNCVDPKLLPEIVAVAKSLQLNPWSREAVLEILEDFFSSRPSMELVKWDMSTALNLYELQALVENFSADFSSLALAKECFTNQDGDTGPAPTKAELRRFERNFWKFELYCNLFRDQELESLRKTYNRFSPKEQKAIFFDRFAAFENEQLGCVHDYLWDQVSRAFDDVAAHDIYWGAQWNIEWGQDYYSGQPEYKEALLSQGLARIALMSKAETYQERYNLVQTKTLFPNYDQDFLVEGLFSGYMDDNGQLEELENLTPQQVKESSKEPSYLESDEGPFEAWKWAYEKCKWYVMWDRDRMVFCDLFKIRRADLPRELDDAYRKSNTVSEENAKSREARSEVFVRGGRGWWSSDDLSQIEWPRNRTWEKLKS